MTHHSFPQYIQPISINRVLVVESNCAIASMLQMVLWDAHIPSMVTRTKYDASMILKGLRPRLILINTHLYDGCGLSLYDDLCQRSPHFAIPTLILSTNLPWYEQQILERELPSIALPLDINTFVETVSSLLPTQLL